MSCFSICELKCCICGRTFDAAPNFSATCSRDCHQEFEWRRVLSIMKQDYYPDPRKEQADDQVVQDR